MVRSAVLGSQLSFYLLSTSLVAGGLACSPGPETVLQPVLRLFDHLESAGKEAARPCGIGGDLRMTLGCPRKLAVLSRSETIAGRSRLELRVTLPGKRKSGTVILDPKLLEDRSVWLPGDTVAHPLPPIVLDRAHATEVLTLPLGPALAGLEEVTVQIEGVPVPRALPAFRTRELELPPNAVFQISIAVAAVAAQAGAAPTVFTVRAHGGFGTREVLRQTIDPAEKSPRWFNHRVDLSPLAGRRAWFEFVSELTPGTGLTGKRFSLPLWGNPQILEARPRGRERNIVLVSLGTLRGDFVGQTYQGRALTPFLDARSAAGASFANAISTYPSTTAAQASLFTSTYPAEHRTFNTSDTLPESLPTLTESLARRGYETAAFTENGMLAADSGFQRGFDDYYENRGVNLRDTRSDMANTFDRGLRWIRSHRGDKFFVFLHTDEVNTPHAPSPDFDLLGDRPRPEGEPGAPMKRDLYAGEVVYTDSILRKLFDTLESLEIAEETIVVVTSDHGEAFGEHGAVGHSRGAYDEVLRVPLIFWAPDLIPAGGTPESQVSIVDLKPTLLDLVGIPEAGAFRGESLAGALLESAPGPDGVRWAEGANKLLRTRGVEDHFIVARTQRYKWIGRVRNAEPIEIYDLLSDPEETSNLVGDEALRARGRALLEQYRELRATDTSARERPVDVDTQRKLEAPAYLD